MKTPPPSGEGGGARRTAKVLEHPAFTASPAVPQAPRPSPRIAATAPDTFDHKDVLRERQFRNAVLKVHRLGPRAVYELLAEISARHLLRTPIEKLTSEYASLDPVVIERLGAGSMPPVPFTVVDGGRAS